MLSEGCLAADKVYFGNVLFPELIISKEEIIYFILY